MMEPVISAVRDTNSFAFIESARPEWIKFEAKGPAEIKECYDQFRDEKHVRLHLDHVPVIDEDHERVDYVAIIKQCLALGFDSVMVDGSRLSLEDNIEATRTVAELSHAKNIPCEAELGAVMGHEEGPMPPYEELFASGKGFTDIEEATRFARETKCDWLSVAIGNIHGAISMAQRDEKKLEARLNLEHLEALAKATGLPLVLHGGTGISAEYLREGMKRGIAKINVGTEIRQPYEQTLRESGDVEKAKQAVYDRTCWYMREHARLEGKRDAIAQEAGR